VSKGLVADMHVACSGAREAGLCVYISAYKRNSNQSLRPGAAADQPEVGAASGSKRKKGKFTMGPGAIKAKKGGSFVVRLVL
jgi:hypothetical protein